MSIFEIGYSTDLSAQGELKMTWRILTLIWIDLPTNCILDYSSTGDKLSALIEYANS